MYGRFMQHGNSERPLSTDDPTPDSLLPEDDQAFDQGVRLSATTSER
jgi:hypothetical protein